jgi:outer membrane protein OmpA-like peptidoglycan-associated protein/tetratricopeptide (TPR) repeat protein
MNKLFTLTLGLFIALMGFSQQTEVEIKNVISKSSEQELIGENSRLLQENFFHFADLVADKLLSFDKDNANYNYRKGFILLAMNQNHELAMNHLLKAIKKTQVNYDIYSVSEKAASVDAFFYLAATYQIDGQYDKAISNYKIFLEKAVKKSELNVNAQNCIKQCEVAKKAISSAQGTTPMNIGKSLNTSQNEWNAQISLDGKVVYFSSQWPWADKAADDAKDVMYNTYPDDVYQMYKEKSGAWSKPSIMSFSNAKVGERLSYITQDERNVFVYNNSGNFLFNTAFQNGVYGPLTPIKDLKTASENSTYLHWNTHYTLSPNGNTIYFVSNAEGGKGKRDLYMAEKLNGVWGAAQNMGGMINTEFDEETPFMGLDNNILYFANNGPESMGGFDIFMVQRDENGMWSKPMNIGFPFNSPSDDLFFTLAANGNQGMVSSNRKGGEGMFDIYALEISANNNNAFLNGQIINPKGKAIPEGSYIILKCLDCNDAAETILSPRMRDGVFVSKLEKCKNYELSYYYGAESRKHYTAKFKTNCETSYEEIIQKVLIDDDNKIIYPFPSYTVRGTVRDEKSGSGIPNASVSININGKTDVVNTDNNGNYISNLINNLTYETEINGQSEASAKDYLNNSNMLQTVLGYDSIVKMDINLTPVINSNIGTFYVNYQFNKHNLTDYSKNKLNEVIKVLNANPNLKVEIRSHTDSRGSAMYNQVLSDLRAKTAREYIQSKITNSRRISSKGYGESELLNSCADDVPCTEEEQLRNRRTEFIIIK